MRYVFDLIGLTFFYISMVAAAGWAFFALWFFEPWPPSLRYLAALLCFFGAVAALVLLSKPWVIGLFVPGMLIVMFLWSFHTPSINRNWSENQARLPFAVFQGDQVLLQNLRHATYRSDSDYDLRWYSQTLDLRRIRTVDFIVEPFGAWRGLAHTFLSFGFEGGEHLAISVEARKSQGVSYSPFKGLFKQYEIMYVIGDERDLIGLRANIRGNPVYLYPVRADAQQVRALFTDMLERSNTLAQRPEFYNTLNNTCNSNIVRHMDKLRGQRHPLDLRVLFPGYADQLALELNLIAAEGSIKTLRERFLINKRSAFGSADENWSERIRERR